MSNRWLGVKLLHFLLKFLPKQSVTLILEEQERSTHSVQKVERMVLFGLVVELRCDNTNYPRYGQFRRKLVLPRTCRSSLNIDRLVVGEFAG